MSNYDHRWYRVYYCTSVLQQGHFVQPWRKNVLKQCACTIHCGCFPSGWISTIFLREAERPNDSWHMVHFWSPSRTASCFFNFRRFQPKVSSSLLVFPRRLFLGGPDSTDCANERLFSTCASTLENKVPNERSMIRWNGVLTSNISNSRWYASSGIENVREPVSSGDKPSLLMWRTVVILPPDSWKTLPAIELLSS